MQLRHPQVHARQPDVHRDPHVRAHGGVVVHRAPQVRGFAGADDEAPFARRQELARLEAECADVAEASEALSAETPADGLRDVLDQQQAMLATKRGEHVDARRRAAHVHRDDRTRMGRKPAAHVVGIERERIVDLGDDRHGADREHRARGRHPCVARHDDLVARPDAERRESGDQRARAGVDRQRVSDVETPREGALELAHARSLQRVARGSVVAEQLLRADDVADGGDGRLLFGFAEPHRAGEHRRDDAAHPRRTHEAAQPPSDEVGERAHRAAVDACHRPRGPGHAFAAPLMTGSAAPRSPRPRRRRRSAPPRAAG